MRPRQLCRLFLKGDNTGQRDVQIGQSFAMFSRNRDRIAKAEASRTDLALLEELCEVVQATSLCGLGQTAPNPVMSTLRYFRHEYEEKLG